LNKLKKGFADDFEVELNLLMPKYVCL